MGRGIAVGTSRDFSSFLRPISPFPVPPFSTTIDGTTQGFQSCSVYYSLSDKNSDNQSSRTGMIQGVRKPKATFPFTFVFMFTIHVHEPKMGRRARGVALPHPFMGVVMKWRAGNKDV